MHLAPFTGGTPDLLAELQSTLVAPLDKKLGNQLKRAKGHGYHSLLLLDQVGNQSMPAGTTWLPSASAVGTIVAQRVAAYLLPDAENSDEGGTGDPYVGVL